MTDTQDEQQIPVPPIEPEIESPEAVIADLTDKWKRSVAEFENFKKRRQSEGQEILEYAKEMTVMKLMPSLQSLEQVLKYAPTDEKYKDWLLGLTVTIQQLEKTMEEIGVVRSEERRV